MKITLITTGGTIGTAEAEGVRRLGKDPAGALLDAYGAVYGKEEWRLVRAKPMLSENNGGARITEIVELTAAALKEDCDGVIVTHGTDTLQYTAAALRYAFGADCAPVVLVSASDPVDDPHTNALYNMRAAVNFIASGRKGVKVAYIDSKSCYGLLKSGIKEPACGIFDADRLSAHETFSDIFVELDGAVGFPAEGVYRKGVRLVDGTVMRVAVYPGMAYPSELPDEVKAIVFECYHSGTLRTEGEDFEAFLTAVKARGITVFLTGVVRDGALYESAEKLSDTDFVPLYGYAPVAAYVKVWYDTALSGS